MKTFSARASESARKSRPGFRVLLLVFVLYAVAQVAWLALDERPVTEERHYFAAARVAHALRGTAIGRMVPNVGHDSPYPPLPAYYTGIILALTRCRADIAVLSLLPFAGLLLWAVWKIGCVFASERAAAAGAVLVLCFHHFIDVEPLYAPYAFINEYLLDLPLSALTAVALYAMLRWLGVRGSRAEEDQDGDERPRGRILALLGLSAGMAMLVKVSAPLYLAIAAAALWTAGYRDRRRWWALWRSAAMAAGIALPWYLLHAGDVAGYLRHHEFNTELALRDGMPAVGSLANGLYYLQALVAMFSPPLAVVVFAAVASIAMARRRGWRLVVTGLLLSYLILTMLWGKSWRFMTPSLVYAGLAVALAIDLAGRRRRIHGLIVGGLVAAACLRMAMMYGIGSPTAEAQGSVVRLAPVPSDGGIARIMRDVYRMRDPAMRLCISVVPVLRRFRHASFRQQAMEDDVPMVADSEWRIRSDAWREELERSEFIVTRTGYNGPARYVLHREEVERWVRQRLGATVHPIATYALPDGATARLYRQERSFANWARHTAAASPSVRVNFDDAILLTDCHVEHDGSRILVHCTWQARSAPEKEYRLFLQVRDGWRNVVAKSFTPGNGLLPVTRWRTDEQIVETYVLPRPPGTARYTVWLGWYRRFSRLPVTASVFPERLNAVELPGSHRAP